jgi:hypothetical protein
MSKPGVIAISMQGAEQWQQSLALWSALMNMTPVKSRSGGADEADH